MEKIKIIKEAIQWAIPYVARLRDTEKLNKALQSLSELETSMVSERSVDIPIANEELIKEIEHIIYEEIQIDYSGGYVCDCMLVGKERAINKIKELLQVKSSIWEPTPVSIERACKALMYEANKNYWKKDIEHLEEFLWNNSTQVVKARYKSKVKCVVDALNAEDLTARIVKTLQTTQKQIKE